MGIFSQRQRSFWSKKQLQRQLPIYRAFDRIADTIRFATISQINTDEAPYSVDRLSQFF